ncbi:DNA repair protein RecO [Aquicella lusitana]|uniref:DNA repair protein RecO n=1 Tax=Aquicella lusitana TaxID=254246 RepID=A0A370GFW5_9COXI|nr:DNA repair protein RecO [Aquicella lusitana]RDI42698.1 DNA replication and repair protein RecO [Aquicella lusitana]VVC73447.1 DNA repair protein RecO [Aquicella lusitana]
MKRVLLQPAYVLHRRLYRESSFLVELFTSEHGRLTVVARGVRKARSPTQGLLQPFIPLLVSWSGNGELMTLSQVEPNGAAVSLRGECLFAGFYLNELLMCLLQKWDAHPVLYTAYEKAVAMLQASVLEQGVLRSFEKALLEELGYGLFPKSDTELQHALQPDHYYRFVPEQGFVISTLGNPSQAKTHIFSGKNLLAIAREDWRDESCLQDAKRLTRFILAPLLGARPIHSRKLFLQLNGEESDK